ncbi:hypothetical protein Tco_0962191 [Tanacetum coccineum]
MARVLGLILIGIPSKGLVLDNILNAGGKINDIGVPFINSFKCKVISGSSTRMWKDVWFGSQSLDQIYPRLFSLALDKDCSVQQWVSATSENRDLWRRDLFLGREMEDLENFDSVIMGLSLQDGVDGWTWSLDTSGSFKPRIEKFHGSLGSKSWLMVPWAALELVISRLAILVFSGSGGGGFRLWINILKAGQKINDIGVPFINSFKRKVISGSSTRIWKDVWFGSQSLDQIYPRLFALALDKNCSVQQWVSASSENRDLWRRDLFLGREMEELENFDSVIIGLSLEDGDDGWTRSLDTSGSFLVSILRSCIDSLELS